MKAPLLFAALLSLGSFASAGEKHCDDIAKPAPLVEGRQTEATKIGELCVEQSHLRKGPTENSAFGHYDFTLVIGGKVVSKKRMNITMTEGAAGTVYESFALNEGDLNHENAMDRKVVFRLVNDDSELKAGEIKGEVSFLGKRFALLMK